MRKLLHEFTAVLLQRCRSLGLLLLFAPALFAADDRGLIYRVGGGDLYLLGSVHMANADFYPLRADIEQAFARTDGLVVELNINAIDPQRVQAWVARNGIYPPGESLRDHLQPATWQRLQSYLQEHQLDPALFTRQKPAMLVVALSAAQMSSAGFSPALGIDQHFLGEAQAQHKAVVELETLEQQLDLLSDWPNPDLLINQTLDQAAQLAGVMDSLSDAWKRGDADALATFLLDGELRRHPEYQPLYERIYIARNRAMTARIRNFLHGGRHYFIVVGAAHLVGDQGIVALLRGAGIQVEQL